MTKDKILAIENEAVELEPGDVTFLRGILGGRVERRIGGWAVRRVVGALQMPSGKTLVVRSKKAKTRAVLRWVAFADPAFAALERLDAIDEIGAEDALHSAVARLFVEELLRALDRNGVSRGYVRMTHDDAVVRGQIDFQRLARRGGELCKIPCRSWQRLPDTPLNRLLATAIHRVSRARALRDGCRHLLPRAEHLLAGVPPHPPKLKKDGVFPISRNDDGFSAAAALASLIIRGTGRAEGESKLGLGFLVNLESLFEKTVAIGFKRAGIGAQAKVPVRYEARGPSELDHSPRAMEMDVYVPPSSARPALVVDAKFKTKVAPSNVQQVVAYCSATGARDATLVLPAGHLTDRRPLYFPTPAGEVRISLVELSTDNDTADAWRAASAAMVEDALSGCLGPSAEASLGAE